MKEREFWKVCKKLNNEERVDVLRRVMAALDQDGLPVGQISGFVRIEQPATSTYLMQIENDCGLVSSKRAGRYCLYRAEPDHADEKASCLFAALKRYFVKETRGFEFVNGNRPEKPAFMAVLPALANKVRAKVVGILREKGRMDKPALMKETGLGELNISRHMACIVECGLSVIEAGAYVWREPDDEISRLFIQLSKS